MKYYVIEEIVEYGSKVSRPLYVVEKEEIAKAIVKTCTGLVYYAYDTGENKDE